VPLQASYTKLTGDRDAAVKMSHHIKRLWNGVRSHDAAYLPGYEIRDSVFSLDTHAGKPLEDVLSAADAEHYLDHQSLVHGCETSSGPEVSWCRAQDEADRTFCNRLVLSGSLLDRVFPNRSKLPRAS
jgi:hypothetical protein